MDEASKNYCTFYIVRHAESESNATGVVAGHVDSSLSKNGVLQAKKLAKELKHIHFDKAFSSDLIRARRTAEIIAIEHALAVETTQLLRERNWGLLQGKEVQEVKALLDRFSSLATKERLHTRIDPTMETSAEMLSRFITFLRETAIAYIGETILIGSHGNLMKVLLEHLGFATYDTIVVTNTAYVVLQCDGTDFFITQTKEITLRG